jgi:hypothetical protein
MRLAGLDRSNAEGLNMGLILSAFSGTSAAEAKEKDCRRLLDSSRLNCSIPITIFRDD